MSKYVCSACVNDPVLAELVVANVSNVECDYCIDRCTVALGAPIDAIVAHIERIFERDYTEDIDRELPYDSEEDRYLGEILNARQILLNEAELDSRILDDVCSHFGDRSFCEHYYFSGDEYIRNWTSWDQFCHVVKHRRRYTYWCDRSGDEASVILTSDILAHVLRNMRHLVRRIDPRTSFWRVRVHKTSENLDKPSDFASTPYPDARFPNRMSPAGIPMFYGADDFETACRETFDPNQGDIQNKQISGMKFETIRKINVLDLTKIKEPRSWFEPWNREKWQSTLFLMAFRNEATKLVKKDEKQHIEYVPSQIFTEVLRWQSEKDIGCIIDGIIYPSSKNGKQCAVIFANHRECLNQEEYDFEDEMELWYFPIGENKLRPIKSSLKRISATDVNEIEFLRNLESLS